MTLQDKPQSNLEKLVQNEAISSHYTRVFPETFTKTKER